ncbi:MAG TPA: MBOAT family protein [Terriglobales bacterium]|nr:MBOAT family protein [Terriglobales bacterium]
MLFNSIDFLIFLPIVLIATRLVEGRARRAVLIAAGYYFYGTWDWRFLGLLMLTTVIDYVVAQMIYRAPDKQRQRQILIVSLIINLGILGFFKYFNFFLDSAVDLLGLLGLQANVPVLRILLPVGISFYTFQSMAYVIDVYRGDAKPVDSFLDYATYVSYFPQLVAGPIERAAHLVPQLVNPARVTPSRFHTGIMLILVGFAKKVLIADSVAVEVDHIFSNASEMSSGMLLRGAYLFTFQIYGDFSGYSDIARGVSELLGVRLMINFNQPYLSQSVTEFWRRWHISLSTWLRDYLYIPLGGNRYGSLLTYRNLMLTMLIGGLWHGANWTFVVWGGLHGAALGLERALGIGPKKGEEGMRTRHFEPLGVLGTLLTFHFAALCWIFFRAPDIGTALSYIAGIVPMTGLSDIGLLPFAVGAALLVIDVPQWWTERHTVFLRLPWWLRSPVYAGIAMLVFGRLMYGGREMPFIYFQF